PTLTTKLDRRRIASARELVDRKTIELIDHLADGHARKFDAGRIPSVAEEMATLEAPGRVAQLGERLPYKWSEPSLVSIPGPENGSSTQLYGRACAPVHRSPSRQLDKNSTRQGGEFSLGSPGTTLPRGRDAMCGRALAPGQ